MVGYSFAKAMAWSLGKPFIGVDHMEGHLFAPRLEHADYAPPAVVPLVSGGHSQIVHMREWGDYEIMGQTIDDAAGEAFDKLARFMGLGYPAVRPSMPDSDGGDPNGDALPAGAPRPSVRLLVLRAQDVGGHPPGEGQGGGRASAAAGCVLPRSRKPSSTSSSTRR